MPRGDSVFCPNLGRNRSPFSIVSQRDICCLNSSPTHLNHKKTKASQNLGSTSISLEDFLAPVSTLSVEKWLELLPSSYTVNSKPIGLRVALSFSIPTPAPHVLQMVRSQPFSKSSCFFPLPGRVKFTKSWTRVIDEAGNEVISLQMRDFGKDKGKNFIFRKEVVGITKYGEEHIHCRIQKYRVVFDRFSMVLQLQNIPNKDSHLFELTGCRTVKLFPGRKLEYEPKHCAKHGNERDHDFMTVVEFSTEDPYGRAVALLDLKSGLFKVKEELLLLPAITLGMEHKEADMCNEDGKMTNLTTEKEGALNVEATNTIMVTPEKGGPGSGGCDLVAVEAVVLEAVEVNVENMVKSGGCGGCGNAVKSTGCGGCDAGGCGAKAYGNSTTKPSVVEPPK
ncbi:DNA-binding protein, putative [Actinidia rufa]|uniref:DNA-binding protein, putative n=1 Tax=Actinidia rufa TaxID=165716 RepID=A0A7J0H704_9ERIC|nr:DNA-binding protein, putative [Actinidia rufa]